MELEKLKNKIEERGYKHSYIAKSLGISRASLSYKINGKVQFNALEVNKLANLLNMSDNEKVAIFFKN